MRTYRDGLGHEYNVPDENVEEFERRRTILLCIKIALQLLVLAGLLWLSWSH